MAAVTAADLADVLHQAVSASGAVGGQLAVWDGAGLTECAAGLADHERGSAMRTDTVIQAGSFAKMLTALLVHQLADEGLVDLDVPVVTYLPDFRVAGDHGDEITPRHLMSMSSGLDFGAYYDFGDDPAPVERYVGTLTGQPLMFRPGTAFAYSGASTVVSALLIERLRGMPWNQAVPVFLLDPAGLTRTGIDDPVPAGASPGHAVGAGGEISVIAGWGSLRATAPNGTTLTSTAGDLARFAALLVRDGVAGNGNRVLAAPGVRRMHEPQIPVRAEMIAQDWCLGPYVRRTPTEIFGHGGRWQCGVCDVMWVPSHDLAIATITNTPSRAGALIQSVSAALLPRLAGPGSWVSPVVEPGLPADAARYTGTYHSPSADFDVSISGDALRLDVIPREIPGNVWSRPPGTQLIYPIGPGRFLPREDTPVERRLQEIWFPLDGDKAEFIYDGLIAGRRG